MNCMPKPHSLSVPWTIIEQGTAAEFAEGTLAQQSGGGANPYAGIDGVKARAWSDGFNARINDEDSPGLFARLLTQHETHIASHHPDASITRDNLTRYLQWYIDRYVETNTRLRSLLRAVDSAR